MLYLYRLINIFNQDHLKKLTDIFLLIKSILPISKLKVKPRTKTLNTKQKYGQSTKANGPIKCLKKCEISSFLSCFRFCSYNRQIILSIISLSALLYFIVSFFYFLQFWIFRYLLVFLSKYQLESFFLLNYLDFPIFFYQFSRRLEIFY